MVKPFLRNSLKQFFSNSGSAVGSSDEEILAAIKRLPGPPSPNGLDNRFQFPWGELEYVKAGQLKSQFQEIFIDRQYSFVCDHPSPVIVDCGGNIGLSAIWFRLNYPDAAITVYEADPDLARISENNLARAGFGDVEVRNQAVWTADENVSFNKTGDDSGRVSSNGLVSYAAIDLSRSLPVKVDLLKMDIEGAEYDVLNKLCSTEAIRRVRNLVCEFHVWRNKMDDFLHTLTLLRQSGMTIDMNSVLTPWLGKAEVVSPFEAVGQKQTLVEVFAWR